MNMSIIIIGAGAAGLQAARILSAAGNRVIVLEASAEPGGRIHAVTSGGFSRPVEGGAEFIHGPLPVTIGLCREAGITLQPVRAQMMRKTGAGDDWEGFMGDDWDELMRQMSALEADMPIADFLSRHFSGQRYAGLRESVRQFAEGYDLADLHRVSTLSLHREWAREGEEEEYRPVGGYRRMIDFLAAQCQSKEVELIYSSPVVEIRWQKGRVDVRTAGGETFTAEKLIVTASLGVLAAGVLQFHPLPPAVETAVQRLGYGSVVKILLEFKNHFWLEKKAKDQTIFVISQEAIPVWWTQADGESGLLTGWLAGERMYRFLQLNAADRLASCLRSVSAIFSVEEELLRRELQAVSVLDWAEAPYIRGGYSFDTVGAADARAVLLRPVEDTIFFAGEALYEGEAPGTVEAALCSGQDVAQRVLGILVLQ